MKYILTSLLFFLIIFPVTSIVWAQDEAPVIIDGEHPIGIFIEHVFDSLSNERMDEFVGCFHPDSESVPTESEIEDANSTFEEINVLLTIDTIKLLTEVDDITLIEVGYIGVLYEEEEPPDFNITEDDYFVVQFQLKKFEDEWRIWDAGMMF